MSRGMNSSEHDNSAVMVVAAVAVLVLMIWLLAHEQIAWLGMNIRLWEAWLLAFDREGQRTVYEWIASRHPRDVGFAELYRSGEVTGYYLRWIVVAILLPAFAWAFLRHPGRSLAFRQKHSILSLARAQAHLYPMMAPIIEMDLLNAPIDHPIHGMRALPRTYARKYKMLRTMSEIPADHPRDDLDVLDARNVLILSRCNEVFAKQIGAEWQGVGHAALPAYERALLVAFAVQLAGLSKDCNKQTLKIIEELAIGARQAFRKGDLALIVSATADALQDAVLAAPKVQKVLRRHGFRRTLLMGLLEEARSGGVVPPGWFRWLKAVDRVTWYALCDLGIQPSCVESAGVRAQYLIEKAAQGPVLTPMVESAVNGLRDYLDEVADDTVED